MKRTLQHLVRSVRSTNDVRREKAQARPCIEALESRLLLSGNVLASVVHGHLNIRGDTAANAIVVDQTGLNADQVRVSGAGDTAINNQASPVILSGVTRGALIRMGKGADGVTLRDLRLPGSVSVRATGGASTLTLDNVQVVASVNIQTGSSLSTTMLANITAGKDLTVVAGSGSQSITLRSVEVRRNTRIVSGGKGNVFLAADDSTFHGALRVSTGKGADVIQLDSRGEPLGLPTAFDGPVSISTNGGNDILQLGVAGQTGNRSAFAGSIRFNGGTGYDTLRGFDASTYSGHPRFSISNFDSNTPAADAIAPTVSSTDPAGGGTGVALNKKIAATFSEAMDPLTITTASVTVMTASGQAPISGTVAYAGTIATFMPDSALAADTTYTVTISTGATDLAGNPLASDFVWSFTTGSTSDTTAPTVSFTDPASNATGVALNKKIAATFSEAMDPLTITAANLMMTAPGQGTVSGTVAYAGTTASFTPASALAPNTTYTVTITTGAEDLAGNPLASDFVRSFTTGATADTTAPTVSSTNPADLRANVLINKPVAATFSESMDALTITTANFTVTGPGGSPVTGAVNYDAASEAATFTPTSNLAPNTTFTATISGRANGVKDLAGNPLVSDKVWTFTTGTQVAQAPINLGSAGAFAVMATASISGTGASQINGDVGLNPGTAQGIPPAQVNGTIHVDDQAIIQAQSDLRAGYNDAVSRSVTAVSLPGNMGGLTFTPGLYTNSTSVLIQGSGPANNVTLDAQGDPNAVFIFQMGSTLTAGVGSQVILAGGAKASNVFWQVGTSATLNTTTIFKGNILAAVTITVNSGSVVEGRLLAGSNSDGSVTVNASTITVPAA